MLQQLASIFDNFFFKLLSAVIILLIGLLIGKILGRFVRKALYEIEGNNIMKFVGFRINIEKTLGELTSAIIYIYTFYLSFSQFGITNLLVYGIGIVILLVVGISFLLSIKNFIPNLFDGFIARRKYHLKVGNNFKFDNTTGKIEKITLKDIKIRTKDNELLFIPYTFLRN